MNMKGLKGLQRRAQEVVSGMCTKCSSWLQFLLKKSNGAKYECHHRGISLFIGFREIKQILFSDCYYRKKIETALQFTILKHL
jgi:hypothetical protein